MNQLEKSEQSIGSLRIELEILKDTKGLIEDQIENQKNTNYLDHPLFFYWLKHLQIDGQSMKLHFQKGYTQFTPHCITWYCPEALQIQQASRINHFWILDTAEDKELEVSVSVSTRKGQLRCTVPDSPFLCFPHPHGILHGHFWELHLKYACSILLNPKHAALLFS